jgi:hypothetical protein
VRRYQADADFFCAAHRFRWAAAIFARAADDKVRRFFGAADWREADLGGRPLRFAGSDPEEIKAIAIRAR